MIGKPALLMTLAIAVTAGPAEAQRSRWQTLSSALIHQGATSETFTLRNTRWYRQIRFCVDRRSVFVNHAWINFHRGASQRFSVQRRINAGNCTFAVNLRSGNISLRSARITFVRLNSGTRPLVRVQGRN